MEAALLFLMFVLVSYLAVVSLIELAKLLTYGRKLSKAVRQIDAKERDNSTSKSQTNEYKKESQEPRT